MTDALSAPQATAPSSDLGVSDWLAIDQTSIDAFADVTQDHQFLHVDKAAAAQGPFGTTIAHGFLSLSLLSRMAKTGLPTLDGLASSINYGFDRVRFLNPVREGSRIRARFNVQSQAQRGGGKVLFTYGVEVEIEGEDRLALSATWLVLRIFSASEVS